jgi:adenylate kinase
VFLGPPACGKGTQAAMLGRELGLPVVVTGEMLRRAAAAGTKTGLEAKGYMDRGELVPDEALNRLMAETVAGLGRGGFILDGYPRTAVQAAYLQGLLAAGEGPLTDAVAIEVPEEELVRRQAGRLICRACGRVYNRYSLPPEVEGRCACGGELYQRSDDGEETIRQRLRVYARSTAPLIEQYRALGILRTVDGLGTSEEVRLSVRKALEAARARGVGEDRRA